MCGLFHFKNIKISVSYRNNSYQFTPFTTVVKFSLWSIFWLQKQTFFDDIIDIK